MENSTETPPQSQQFDRGRHDQLQQPERPEHFIHPSRQHIHDRNARRPDAIVGNAGLKTAIRQIEDRAQSNAPHAHYDRSALRGIKMGSIGFQRQTRVGGDAGLSGTAHTLATLADPNTRLAISGRGEGHERQIEQEEESNSLPANTGITLPQTHISVQVVHHNQADSNPLTDTSTASVLTGAHDEAMDLAETTIADQNQQVEEPSVEDFIKVALQSVTEAQKQESMKLMEALGLTLVQELKTMHRPRQEHRREAIAQAAGGGGSQVTN